jgi:hypothetical protein
MQFSIGSGDVKKFLNTGKLTLENIISEDEASFLIFEGKDRDPHREIPSLARLATSRKLALTAAHLANKAPLRLGFTEWIDGPLQPITEWSSIQPIVIALLLHPDRSGTFINPEVAIEESSKGFLIAYSPLVTLYTYNLLDPHVHDLKKCGYAFGDHLGNETHPVVCKDFFS